MSEHETEAVEGLDQPEEVRPNSIMESLRRDHKALVKSKTFDLPIPGYNGSLVAQYRLMGIKELEIIGNKVQREFKKQGDRVLHASLDALITGCLGLYYNRNGELVGLHESIGDEEPPIRFDDRLVEFLALDISDDGMMELMPKMDASDIFQMGDARRTVLAAFGGNDIAVLDHGNTIGRWSSDTTREVSERFLGEA